MIFPLKCLLDILEELDYAEIIYTLNSKIVL